MFIIGFLSMDEKQKRKHSLLKFTLQPIKVTAGKQKLTANIKNTGDEVLRNMVLLLHSLNENLSVKGGERFIYALMPGQETTLDLQVSVASNAQVYFSLSGFKNCDVYFTVDSQPHQIIVEETKSSSKQHS
jgi:hypothetical protein